MIKYKCFIDSISIRVNHLRLENFLKSLYPCYYYHRKAIVFKHKEHNLELFSLRTAKEQFTGIEYQYISFNGLKKYHILWDSIILETFDTITDIFRSNDIDFYLRSIDLAVDFYNVDITDLFGTERINWQGTLKKKSLENLDITTIQKIRNNDITFYLDNQKSRTHCAYIYNKSLKELKKHKININQSIYRFEAKILGFNKLEKDVKQYKIDLLETIKRRFEKYKVICIDKEITFDYSILDSILAKSNKY